MLLFLCKILNQKHTIETLCVLNEFQKGINAAEATQNLSVPPLFGTLQEDPRLISSDAVTKLAIGSICSYVEINLKILKCTHGFMTAIFC
jgi:hypothetical protein